MFLSAALFTCHGADGEETVQSNKKQVYRLIKSRVRPNQSPDSLLIWLLPCSLMTQNILRVNPLYSVSVFHF